MTFEAIARCQEGTLGLDSGASDKRQPTSIRSIPANRALFRGRAGQSAFRLSDTDYHLIVAELHASLRISPQITTRYGLFFGAPTHGRTGQTWKLFTDNAKGNPSGLVRAEGDLLQFVVLLDFGLLIFHGVLQVGKGP